MPKAILIIGRLCCGKSTYARRIAAQEGAVLISCDELMRTLFPHPLGDDYDLYAFRCQDYLLHMARRIAQGGATPVVDFGFWTRASRERAAQVLAGLDLDWRYLNISREEWRRRIASRNRAIAQGVAQMDEYYVDEGLLNKCFARFEEPEAQEGLEITCIG